MNRETATAADKARYENDTGTTKPPVDKRKNIKKSNKPEREEATSAKRTIKLNPTKAKQRQLFDIGRQKPPDWIAKYGWLLALNRALQNVLTKLARNVKLKIP